MFHEFEPTTCIEHTRIRRTRSSDFGSNPTDFLKCIENHSSTRSITKITIGNRKAAREPSNPIAFITRKMYPNSITVAIREKLSAGVVPLRKKPPDLVCAESELDQAAHTTHIYMYVFAAKDAPSIRKETSICSRLLVK